ncbi:hypothetical protein JXD38_09085 [candidate division WOR-3 bacterium]|nr:hypothetical protein [candidate division WOR-3 bacterium]
MRTLLAVVLAAVAGMTYARDGTTPTAGVPEMKNLEHGTVQFWHDVKFTPDTTDPAGKRGRWSGWFHQDVVDASKLKDGIIRGKIDGQWLDLKVVSLPDDFCKWNFGKRVEQLGVIKKMMAMPEGQMGGMVKPEVSGPHNAMVASHGMKRKDSEFDINNAVKGTGWLPEPEKLPGMIALLKQTWDDSMDKKLALLESLYTQATDVFDRKKQSSLELYSQSNFETHTFLNQMTDPGVAVVYLDLPKSYELRCVAQMLDPNDPGLSDYERQVVEYINLVHDYFHGQSPRRSIGVIYHVVQVFDNSPGMMRGQRIVPALP